MVDLHSHSTASDGELSPAELVLAAKERGVSVLALTDHDTLGGLEEAAAAAKGAGVEFVPGVELSVQRPKGEFHLLGLGLDLKNVSASMRSLLADLKRNRIERNKKILFLLQNDGLDVDYADFLRLQGALHPEETLGRPHIAAYLVQKGVVKSRQAAFARYLGNKSPFFAELEGAPLEAAAKAILDSGGAPVVAHPLSLYESWKALPAVLERAKDAGVLGMEAWHPGAKEGECRRLERLARELGLFVTAGSDFHGPGLRADRKLGRTAGNYNINDRFWTEELSPALRALRS